MPATTNQPPKSGYETALEGFKAAQAASEPAAYWQQQATQAAAAGTATEEERRKAREQLAALAGAVGSTAQAAEQAKLAEALAKQASGEEPGAGQLQLRRALEATQAATASQLASVRGMNPAAAQRLLLQQQAGQAQQAAGQSAMVALEEQGEAQKQLAGLLGQMRGQTAAEQQLAANITEAMRQGDTAAAQQLIAAAQAQAQTSIAQQAQALGLVDTEGRLDVARLQAKVSEEIARINRDAQAGLLNDQQAEAERTYWRNLLVNMQLGSQAAAGTAMMQSSIGQGRAKGGRIDGKGLVPGDHPANDIVPAMLSPGEIVLPRSIAQAEDAPEKAAAFVRALRRTEAAPLSRRAAAERIAELEAEIAALRAVKAQKEER